MNKSIFREYDIRGVVETDLTPDVVTKLGAAFGSRVMRAGGKSVAIGRDVRLTGDTLFKNLSDGIRSTGCNVVSVGVVPTPLLYFAHQILDVNAAIMITGSHNPPEFNGFKLLINKHSVHGKDIQALMNEILEANFESGSGSIEEVNIISDYCKMVQEKVKLSRSIKVVIDSGNGCGGIFSPALFRDMGCEVIELFSEPDGRFPNHHPDPTVEANNKHLREAVLKHGAELGIGYDGDADRIGVLDEKGNQYHGDQILMIFAREILSRKQGAKIVFDVKCSKHLQDDITKHGGVPLMNATGHSLIKQRMIDEQAELAGEMSAHIFFADGYFGYDDAIYATARFLQIVAEEKKPVSRLLEDVPPSFTTPEIRVDCADEEKFAVVDEMVAHYKNSPYSCIDLDGIRVEFENGWGLIRASNTQPVLVLRFEADTEENLQKYKNEVYSLLIKFPQLEGLSPF